MEPGGAERGQLPPLIPLKNALSDVHLTSLPPLSGINRKSTPTIMKQPDTGKKEKKKKATQFPHTITLSPILLFLNSIYFN